MILRRDPRTRRGSPDRAARRAGAAGLDPRAPFNALADQRRRLCPDAQGVGNWLAAEELAQAAALRTLRKPRVPDKLVEPISDDAMRRLLAVADVRDRAIVLLLLDCGLRVSEAAGLRLGDLRPDGTLKVMGKGAKERIVPVGGTARTAIVRYMGQRCAGAPTSRSSSVDAARSAGGGCNRSSSASRTGPGSPGGAARTGA